MKKFLLLTVASLMTVFAMAIGRNDGSSQSNAIDFKWDTGVTHTGGTKWYRVGLEPLYQEDNPALNLYLTNPSRDKSVDVSVTATVGGETKTKEFTVEPHQNKSWSENASLLVRLQQEDIYLTLTSSGEIKLSAKVYESTDLDETCKDSRTLKWDTRASQTAGYAAWWKLDISSFKELPCDQEHTCQDVKVTVFNKGNETLHLKAGVSFDCPSSGLTEREVTVAAGKSTSHVFSGNTVRMLTVNELYGYIVNDQDIEILVTTVDQPDQPVFDDCNNAIKLNLEGTQTIPAGSNLYYISIEEALSVKSHEPELTFLNNNDAVASMTIDQAFECPAYSTNRTSYKVAAQGEEVVVYKRNMFEGLTAGIDKMYIYITTNEELVCNGRLKHIREGKACKTNIDFNWATGHTQDAEITQWYAVDLKDAKANTQDVILTVENLNLTEAASLTAELAYSCPSFDTQEITRSMAAGKTAEKRIPYGTYSLLGDTVYVALTTTQKVHFSARTEAAEKNFDPEADCFSAEKYDFENGGRVQAGEVKWYKVAMKDTALIEKERHPVLFVQNYSETNAATVNVAAVENCNSEYATKATRTIAAKGTYTHDVSFDLLKNFSTDTVYVRVESSELIAFEIRLTDKPEGSDCSSAIPFNWVSGNDQDANANLWYKADLREAMRGTSDIEVEIVNKDNETCNGKAWLAYTCPFESPQVQGFTLEPKADKKKVFPHSSLEIFSEDSVAYFRVIGNTALHFEAHFVPAKDFDTIHCEAGFAMQPLEWNTVYTQTADTAWYVIEKDMLESLADLTTTPEIWVHNTTRGNNTIKAEVAYQCPIVSEMISKTMTFSANQEATKLIERSTYEQIMKKDMVIIRLTGEGSFEFSANLVDPNTGDDEMHPVRLVLKDTTYVQEANTTLWYKVNAKELKADDSLHGKSVKVTGKNLGDGTADVRVEVYEDAADLSNDLLEGHGHRTASAGKTVSKSIPAYAAHALGDVEVLIKVTTTQKLSATVKLSNYASAAVDPNQALAKLAVPNVDYIIPADTTMWFAMCVPYMRNNFDLSVDDIVTFKNLGNEAATITVTGTCQDELSYQIPVRSRTVAAGRGGSKTIKQLADKAIKKAGFHYSIMETKSHYIDSLLEHFLTKDSVTAYVRIHTTQPLLVRLDSKRKTGDECLKYMPFDWEHGNVNPKGETTWIKVQLKNDDGTYRVPEGNDLELHLDNWSDGKTNVTVEMRPGDCDKPIDGSFERLILKDTTKVIERQLLETWGWTDLMLTYYSDSTTHIWAKLVPPTERDTIYTNRDSLYVCLGEEFEDEYTHEMHTITDDPLTWTWSSAKDSIFKEEAKIVTYIDTFHVLPLVQPEVIDITTLTTELTIKRGEPIGNVDAAAQEIFDALENARADSTMIVGRDSVIWQYSLNGTDFVDVTDAPITSEAISLRYKLLTECGDELFSDQINNLAHGDTLRISECHSYTWYGRTFTQDTLAVDTIPSVTNTYCDSVIWLDLKINPAVEVPVIEESACKTFTWDKNGETYTESITVSYTKESQTSGICDSIFALALTILPPVEDTITPTNVCYAYKWEVTGETYVRDTVVTRLFEGAAFNGCDSLLTLDLKLGSAIIFDLEASQKYGNRLLMINRNKIMEVTGWELDSIESGASYVTWYTVDEENDKLDSVGVGYYFTTKDGSPVPSGIYCAIIRMPATDGNCGSIGYTQRLDCRTSAAPAPALVPTMAQPGEEIRVIYLDPKQQNIIRIYTTEGFRVGTYTVSGEDTFRFKAAADHGFYIVEINNDSMKSTLRYIVK